MKFDENLRLAYEERVRKAVPKFERVFRSESSAQPPVVVVIQSYWSCGSDKSQMPEDYYNNPASMLKYQEYGIKLHLENLDDDYVPYLVPWYGTGVLPSGFGCEIRFLEKQGMDPVVAGPCVTGNDDIAKLRLPNPYKDGIMPRVLETIDFMRENSEIPVSLTDIQGPLDTLGLMCGHERLFTLMYDDPKTVHYLFELVTEALIDWIKVQKQHTGESLDEIRGVQNFWCPKGCGVWISEDDLVFLGPRQYEDFVFPYHSKILRAFGSGVLHFCGDASHHIPALKYLESLAAINLTTLWDFNCLKKLQEQISDKVILMVWDIAPLDVQKYYEGLLDSINLDGIILGLAVEENIALSESGYILVDRTDLDAAMEALNVLKAKLFTIS